MRAAWHPSRAVLEVLELVLDGALPGSPELGSLGSGPVPSAGPDGLTIEDAEGAPVAVIDVEGRPHPAGPFTHSPLRAHRRTPAQVRAELAVLTGTPSVAGPSLAGPVIGVPVANVPAAAEVEAVIDQAARAAARLLWLAVVGQGREGLPPEALLRAVRELADRASLAGVPGLAVPVAVPVLPGRPDQELLTTVATGYGADRVVLLPAAGPDRPADPVFARELTRARRPAHRRGVTVFLTGLSGSGKSTIAKRFTERLIDDGRRTVTLLDGDEVRRLLSAGLGFSRADRELNIRRIGFVAAEVTRHGGVAVCAPIAPFADVRAQVRADVEAVGDLLLVHIATPLAECERRDRKGLYAAARRGEVAEFTGVSSPYQRPDDADLRIDTTGRSVESCVDDLWQLFDDRGYLSGGAADCEDERGL